MVEGPAGIGKTVLLAAARDAAEGEGFRVLRARGAELEREFAFGVVRQLVEPVVAGASEEERSQLLDGPPGVAARLLGLPGLGDGVATAAPIAPDPSFAVLHGLYWLCANLAAQRPLALVVDDAHWADGASLRFLAFLLPRLEELHVAVLLGARPAEAGESRELLAALTMDPATEVVTVGPLTTKGVATLVAAGLGVEPEPEFAAACWEATGGTPFLVRTLVEALREEQIAPVAASAAKVQNVATVTLSRWAMLRLVRLGPDAAPPGSGGGRFGAGRVGPGGPAGRARTPRRSDGPPICWSGQACWTRLRFVSPIHFCAAPSTVTWRRPTGSKRTGAPPGCWPKHTPTRLESPSTCWRPYRQATAGRSNSCGLPPGRQRRGARRNQRLSTYAGPCWSRHHLRRGRACCSNSVWPSSAPASRVGTTNWQRRWSRPATTRPASRPRCCSRMRCVGMSGPPRR